MDIKKLADVKDRFADYEKIFNSGDYDKAADILSAILERTSVKPELWMIHL